MLALLMLLSTSLPLTAGAFPAINYLYTASLYSFFLLLITSVAAVARYTSLFTSFIKSDENHGKSRLSSPFCFAFLFCLATSQERVIFVTCSEYSTHPFHFSYTEIRLYKWGTDASRIQKKSEQKKIFFIFIFTGHGWRSGVCGVCCRHDDVFMDVLHVLHKSFIAQEELVAQRAASRIGPTNKGRMLFIKKFKLQFFQK